MKKNSVVMVCALMVVGCLIAPTKSLHSKDHPQYLKVETGGGPLVMRDAPDKQGKPLGNIPNGEIVALVETIGDESVIAGKKGKWTKITWESKTGWAFGGFLNEVPMDAPEEGATESEEAPKTTKTVEKKSSETNSSFVVPIFLILIITSGILIYFRAKKQGKLNQRGTSLVPLIMGIIGAVIQLPGALCAGLCAGGVSSALSDGSKSLDATMAGVEATGVFLGIGLLAALIGFVSGLFGKKSPILAGIGLLSATLLTLLLSIVTFNIFSLIAFILFLIGTIFAFVQKREST